MAVDIFISYRSLDENIVKRVMTTLEENNLSCWYAPKDIKAGGKHDEVIMPAIESSKIFMFFLSENNWPRKGNEKAISKWVRAELLTAIDYDHIYFLPIKLDSTVDEPTINLAYKALPNYFDLTLHSLDNGIDALVNLVKSLLENDKYKLDTQNNFREAYKQIDLSILKDIQKYMREGQVLVAKELLENNPSLKRSYSEDIQVIEILLKLLKGPVKDMSQEDIHDIIPTLKSLRNGKHKNISYYLEALISESFFRFNSIANNMTDGHEILKQLSKQEPRIEAKYLLILKNIKSVNSKFQINWLRK